MKIFPPPLCLALSLLLTFALVGCGTTTTVRLTGTPGTQINGSYRANHNSVSFSGGSAWQLDLGHKRLQELEFSKVELGHAVELDIRQGHKSIVHATAEPGVRGLKVRRENGWRVEPLK